MILGCGIGDDPGIVPPRVLIFFHIPKTGGTTVNSIIRRCLGDKHFDMGIHDEPPDTSLWTYATARIAKQYNELSAKRRDQIRCATGEHITYDVDTIFNRSSKFFTLLREPVDRVISGFFFSRTLNFLPCYRFIKDLTLEQYLDSGIGLDHDNQQVRMLSGCSELDAPWDPEGRRISTIPVERVHLEMAKRNIDERFIVAAPLEEFTALIWYLKRLYGWPLRRVLFPIDNETEGRPRVEAVSEATRRRLEALNQYDIELYEWVKARFAKQIAPLEPSFSRDVRRFDVLNRASQRIYRLMPDPIRRGVRSSILAGPV